MLSRLVGPLFLVLAATLLLHAQDDGRAQDDGPIKMTPDLALAIPLEQKGKDIMVKFPVLISRTLILKPGMVLRNLYVPPNHDDSENLVAAHVGTMEQSYSRTATPTDDQPTLPPSVVHELERQRRIVWEVPINFQLALAQLPTDNLHLIYQTSSDDRHPLDERLSFFEGLFLGAPGGGVSVLAVEVGSKAEAAGFKAGDQIVGVGGKPINDLAAFPNAWSVARQEAKDSNAPSFSFIVRSQGASTSHVVNLAMPPSIKSMLMQGF